MERLYTPGNIEGATAFLSHPRRYAIGRFLSDNPETSLSLTDLYKQIRASEGKPEETEGQLYINIMHDVRLMANNGLAIDLGTNGGIRLTSKGREVFLVTQQLISISAA